MFVCNHSGGKDSQAMFLYLSKFVPKEQLFIIYSDLGEVEWEGSKEHIESTIFNYQEFHIVRAVKTFFDMVLRKKKPMFPSPKNRQCTSDLKRGPINKKIIEISNRLGYKYVVNCMGLRAQESSGRAKKPVFQRSEDKSNSKRTWFEWLPIHSRSTDWVFDYIKSNGQNPHWVYAKGMTRKSCCFCIFSTEHDLKTAAKLRPELAKKYSDIERQIDHTLIMPSAKKGKRFLDEIISDKPFAWWKNKDVKDLPAYIQNNRGEIRQVIEYYLTRSIPEVACTIDVPFGPYDREYFDLELCVPATKKQYEKYLKSLIPTTSQAAINQQPA